MEKQKNSYLFEKKLKAPNLFFILGKYESMWFKKKLSSDNSIFFLSSFSMMSTTSATFSSSSGQMSGQWVNPKYNKHHCNNTRLLFILQLTWGGGRLAFKCSYCNAWNLIRILKMDSYQCNLGPNLMNRRGRWTT